MIIFTFFSSIDCFHHLNCLPESEHVSTPLLSDFASKLFRLLFEFTCLFKNCSSNSSFQKIALTFLFHLGTAFFSHWQNFTALQNFIYCAEILILIYERTEQIDFSIWISCLTAEVARSKLCLKRDLFLKSFMGKIISRK